MRGFLPRSQAHRRGLPSGARVLEVAPGPGFFAIELAKLGKYTITGLDISRTFVEIATKNARQAGVTVDFQQGNAAAMPFTRRFLRSGLLLGRIQEFLPAGEGPGRDASRVAAGR